MDWRERAACRDMDPERFVMHLNATEAAQEAKRVCVGCPTWVRVACLEECLAAPSVLPGVFGGTSERERRNRARARAIAAGELPVDLTRKGRPRRPRGSVVCADRACFNVFVRRNRQHRFCSRRCKNREYQRRWRAERYATDPDYRARQRDYARAWRASLSDAARRAEKAKQAAWRERNNADRYRRARERYAIDEVYRQRILAKQRERDRAKAAAKRERQASEAA